jgi:hypothetical protein
MERAAMADSRKYRIVSDGTPGGTAVFDLNGEKIKNVRSVKIEMARGLSMAIIDLIAINPDIDVVVEDGVNRG